MTEWGMAIAALLFWGAVGVIAILERRQEDEVMSSPCAI